LKVTFNEENHESWLFGSHEKRKMKILLLWVLIGIVISCFKIRQSRKYGFDRRVGFSTLPHILIGILLWPIILFYILGERRAQSESLRRLRMRQPTQLDREFDEIEKVLDEVERGGELEKDSNKLK